MNERWNLDPIYKGFGDSAFGRDLQALEQAVKALNEFAADLAGDPAALLKQGLQMQEKISELVQRLFTFAELRQAADTQDAEAGSQLGRIMGINPKNIVIGENGKVIEITKKSIKCEASVPAGAVLVDGSGVGEVGSVVMRDRHRLAEDGMVVVVMPFSSNDHKILADPEIVTRGFIYVKEAEELIEELKRVTLESVAACEAQHINDFTGIKSKVKNNISGYLYKTTRRSPMILPVITEI